MKDAKDKRKIWSCTCLIKCGGYSILFTWEGALFSKKIQDRWFKCHDA